MSRYLTALLIFILICTISRAQENTGNTEIKDIFSILQDHQYGGKVNIYQDVEIPVLVKKHVQINEKIEGFPGYRIQIFFDSSQDARQKADKIKTKFITKHPDIKIYTVYNHPNYTLRCGDFRKREEAYKCYNSLLEDYPKAFIVKDMIKFPDSDE